MTLSIAGRCAETGMLGGAVTSSSICVASRCLFTRAGVGSALTQNVTDPSLGEKMLNLLESGSDVKTTLYKVVSETNNIQWRQLLLLDSMGSSALHTGEKVLGLHSTVQGNQCAAAANLLSNQRVTSAMVEAFEKKSGHLADRLITALEAGVSAGGEEGPVFSAGVEVSHKVKWPIVDLRVDWDHEPIAKLHTIWNEYKPQLEDYLTRALNPDDAPSYGVPGDM